MKIGTLRALFSVKTFTKTFSSFRLEQTSVKQPISTADLDCAYNRALKDGKFELRFLIPSSCMTKLLGKGGENLKELQEKIYVADRKMETRLLLHESLVHHIETKLAECRDYEITVFNQKCPGSTDRVILIKATKKNMSKAVQALADLLCQFPITEYVAYYTSKVYDSSLVDTYGGLHNELFSDFFSGYNDREEIDLEQQVCRYCGENGHLLLACNQRFIDISFNSLK